MDFFMGLKGKDFVVLCSDTVASNSIIRMKADEDKLVKVDDHKMFALAGIFDPPLFNYSQMMRMFRHQF